MQLKETSGKIFGFGMNGNGVCSRLYGLILAATHILLLAILK